MSIRPISFVVAIALAIMWDANHPLSAHTSSFRDFGKNQFTMGCLEQPCHLALRTSSSHRSDRNRQVGEAKDCTATTWLNLGTWANRASGYLPPLPSIDTLTQQLLHRAHASVTVRSLPLTTWAQSVGRACTPPQSISNNRSLAVRKPQLGRPPSPQSATQRSLGPHGSGTVGESLASKFQPFVIRDWRLGPFAKAVPFRLREAEAIAFDDGTAENRSAVIRTTTRLEASVEAEALAQALMYLDDLTCRAAGELATLHSVAKLSQNAVRGARDLSLRTGAQLASVLAGWHHEQHLPFFTEPPFVICEVPDGSMVLITLEQATRWNILQRFENAASIADDLQREVEPAHTAVATAQCPLFTLLSDAITRTRHQSQILIEQVVAGQKPLAKTSQQVKQILVVLSDWIEQVTEQQLASATGTELR